MPIKFSPRWLQAATPSLSPLKSNRMLPTFALPTTSTRPPCRCFASSLHSLLSRVSSSKPAAPSELFSSATQTLVTPHIAPRTSSTASALSSEPSPSSEGTTLIHPSSPYHQEDTLLERVAITGYGANHFDVFAPSALPRDPSGEGPAYVAAPGDLPTTVSLTLPTYVAPEPASAMGGRAVNAPKTTFAMTGGILVLPTAVFLWAPKKWSDVTIDSLAVIDLLQDRPDLILFGSGSTVEHVSPELSSYLSSRGIGYEVLQSANACGTFNILADENRLVMAAIIPHGKDVEDDDEEAEIKKEMESRPSFQLRRRIEEELQKSR